MLQRKTYNIYRHLLGAADGLADDSRVVGQTDADVGPHLNPFSQRNAPETLVDARHGEPKRINSHGYKVDVLGVDAEFDIQVTNLLAIRLERLRVVN
jgi:hypothetical protein